MLASVMSKLAPGKNTYEYFTYLGSFPAAKIPVVSNYEAPKTSFCSYMSNYDWYCEHSADLVVAKNVYDTLDISVRKMDAQVTREYLKCPMFEGACNIVSERFSEALLQPSMSLEQAFLSMDMSKATGYVLRQNGYKKK